MWCWPCCFCRLWACRLTDISFWCAYVPALAYALVGPQRVGRRERKRGQGNFNDRTWHFSPTQHKKQRWTQRRTPKAQNSWLKTQKTLAYDAAGKRGPRGKSGWKTNGLSEFFFRALSLYFLTVNCIVFVQPLIVGVVLVSVMQPLGEQFARLSWLNMHVRWVYQGAILKLTYLK